MKKSLRIISTSTGLLLAYCLFEVQPEKVSLYKSEFFFEKLSDGYYDTSFDPVIVEKEKFNYLGQGLQSVAFESQDHQTVIKFFKKNKIRTGFDNFSSKFKQQLLFLTPKKLKKKELKKVKKLSRLVKNYSEYFKKLEDHSTVLSIQAGKSSQVLPTIELVDPNQKSSLVDLNRVAFIVQKKAELFVDKINQAASIEEKQRLSSLMKAFFEKRAYSGFTDIKRTMSLEKNYGFIGDLPVQFDIGNVIYDSRIESNPKKEILEILELYDKFLKLNEMQELVSSTSLL